MSSGIPPLPAPARGPRSVLVGWGHLTVIPVFEDIHKNIVIRTDWGQLEAETANCLPNVHFLAQPNRTY